MRAYGIKRNYSYGDDYLKNAEARRRTTQAKLNRRGRRIGRHRDKNALRVIISRQDFDQ